MVQSRLGNFLVPLVLLLVSYCLPLTAQQLKQPLPAEELVSALSLASDSASLSPDGQWLAYTLEDPRKVKSFDYSQQPYGTDSDLTGTIASDVWITNTQSGSAKNLTGGVGVNWGPVWSPDGNFLAFYSTRSGKPNLWIYETKASGLRQLSALIVHPFRQQIPHWTPDSMNLLVKIEREEQSTKEAKQVPSIPGDKWNEHVKQPGTTAIIYRSSSKKRDTSAKEKDSQVLEDSVARAERADLALVDANTGAVQRIALGFSPDWYSISPDGAEFAFASRKGSLGGNRYQDVFDLAVTPANGQSRVIASDIVLRNSAGFLASWSPDGKSLGYVSDGDCYVAEISGTPPRKVTEEPHPPFSGSAPLWDSLGHNLYFVTSGSSLWKVSLSDRKSIEVVHLSDWKIASVIGWPSQGRFWSPGGGRSLVLSVYSEKTIQSGFVRIDLDSGAATVLQHEAKVYTLGENLNSASSQYIMYVAEDVGHEPNLWILGKDFKSPRQVTDINPRLSLYAMGKSELISWQTLDGRTIRGALLLPAGYHEGEKYPLIVFVYGGASGSECLNCFGLFESWSPPMNKQLLATRGYAVLYPDAPVRVGTQMQDLADTVLPGVNKVIEMGIADPDKLGVMGQSYGGYSTLALLVQTTRFKAGVMISGVGDLVGFAGEMGRDGASLGWVLEERGWRGSMPGSLWQFRDAYIENSPVFYLDRLQTPLLIIHGASDANASAFLGDEVFVFLRRLGKEAVYVKYDGEGHRISGYANQIDYCNRMIDWFDKYVKSAGPIGLQDQSTH